MTKVLPCLAAVVLCGCLGPRKSGQSQLDTFDAVRIDQMTGNNVSGAPFQRTLFCLNARRETRRLSAVTNQVLTLVTNPVVSFTTNVYSASASNTVITLATNQMPLTPVIGTGSSTNEESASRAVAQAAPEPATNSAVTRTADTTLSTSSGNHQAVTSVNTQSSVAFNNQSTIVRSNVALSTVTSGLVRTEASQTVTAVTNFLISAITNEVILSTNALIYDHYLYTEVTPPPDFSLAPGESLVVLVDGTRHAFSPTNTTASAIGRQGFLCTLYQVPPEVLVAIANAQEVRVRLRGVNSDIDRTLSVACRNRFREFLSKYYTPEAVNPELPLRSLDHKRDPEPAPTPEGSST